MTDNNAEESPRFDICPDVRGLLRPADVSSDKNWLELATKKKCVYLRGLGWLRRVMADGHIAVTAVPQSYVDEMKEILRSQPEWQASGFDWEKPFSRRQFINVLSLNSTGRMNFQKALECMVMAEVVLKHLLEEKTLRRSGAPPRPSPAEVYRQMWVEPAVYYINRLSTDLLEKHLNDDLRKKLRDYTGQLHWKVFEEMTGGKKPKMVTCKLATRLYEFLIHIGVNPLEIDPPQCHYDPRHHTYIPSEWETFDLDESTLPGLPAL